MSDDPATAPSFPCPRCGHVSYNPNDIREGYCGACHDWTAVDSICFFHGYEPSHPGDYKLCGECGHIWRTELDFRTDEANTENAFRLAMPGMALGFSADYPLPEPRHVTPEDIDPGKVYSCPLCTHDW